MWLYHPKVLRIVVNHQSWVLLMDLFISQFPSLIWKQLCNAQKQDFWIPHRTIRLRPECPLKLKYHNFQDICDQVNEAHEDKLRKREMKVGGVGAENHIYR